MFEATDYSLADHVAQFVGELQQFAERVPEGAEPTDDALLAELTASINRSLADCTQWEQQIGDQPEVLKGAQARYRAAIWPWFDQSWFMHRALVKPRGYPGDYELLTAIYNRQTRSKGFGGYLDRYFLNTTLGRAVPARMRAVREFLLEELNAREGDVSILNVASGPCREYTEQFFPTQGRNVRLTCLDNDQMALDFVTDNVVPHIADRIQVDTVRFNALRMTSSRHNRERFGRPDIIYSVGLCDYIPDQYLIPMLRTWRESVAEGGVVYVAFKDCLLYDKAEYQWLVDWYFYQRTENDCRRLFLEAGYDVGAMDITRDETNVIINFAQRNLVPSVARVDAAEATPPAPATDSAPVRRGSSVR
jgi:hypothetical protein